MKECVAGALRGKTRVLVTHQVHFLHMADYVVVLDGDQHVCFAGNRDAFVETSLYTAMAAEVAHGPVTDSAPVASLAEKLEDRGAGPSSHPSGGDETSASLEVGRLIVTEEKAVGAVPWPTYAEYVRHCGGAAAALGVLGVFAVTECLSLSSSVWLSLWSTRVGGVSVTVYLSVYTVLVLASAASLPLRFVTAYNAMRRGSSSLHRALLHSIATATIGFFDTTPHGRILNRFTRDVDQMDMDLQFAFILCLQALFAILSSVTVIVVSQPLAVVAIAPCAVVYRKLIGYYNAASREVRRLGNTSKSPLLSLLSEVLAGARTIGVYERGGPVMAEALRCIDLVYSCSYAENAFSRWLGVRIEFLSTVVVVAVALLGVVAMQLELSSRSIGLISLSLTMALQTTSQMNALVRQVANVEASMNSVERVLFYTNSIEHESLDDLRAGVQNAVRERNRGLGGPTTAASAATHVTIHQATSDRCAAVVVAGSLEFRGVDMRYRDGLPLVLRGVSFQIAPRQKVGVVGRTGSGKSTLLLTFMRLVNICGGEIVVCGRPIQSYGLRELRQLFAMIPQDPVLFDGTVRTNLDPFLEASAEEVWGVLELVGMRERVAAESGGIDSRVLEGGSNFSVGQRQLLCLARALLKRGSGFILMDEATANIDQGLDKQIQRTVMTAFAAYTVITIAHRLHTVANYDTIIVMDHGCVAEIGSPRELARSPMSVFRSMMESMGAGEAERFLAPPS